MKKINSLHANSSARQQKIIAAALTCFTEKGYTETSIADICNASAASTGSVYHHFRSKNGVAIAIYLEGIRDYQNGMVKTLSAHADARAGIFAVVDYHLRWVSRNPAWARFLFEYRHAEFMSDAEDAMKGLNTEFSKGMGEWFGRHIQAGDLKRLPKDVIIALLLGPCQEFSRLYIAGHAETAVPEASQAIAEGAWISLKRDA